MALDPNAAFLRKMMSNQIGNYQNRMDQLQEELDKMLIRKNITIVQLFHRIAIRCVFNE
jgi:hypothetical protein